MKTILITSLMMSLLFFSMSTFAQSSLDSTANSNLAFAETLQQQAHVICHVTRQKNRTPAIIQEIELTVTNSKADVAITYVNAAHVRTVKNFNQRNWVVGESFDDHSMETQYEALVNLTDDPQNFLMIQFYANQAEAHGLLQTTTNSYDLLCR